MQSSKSTKAVRDRNSTQSVFHHLSSLPTVIGCWGRLLMWWMPSLESSLSNSVSPLHAVYWRPWSVRISLGLP